MLVIRRVHLYAGLFLLPWVFLYGITGAMFNHQELFPAATFQQFKTAVFTDSPMADFPSPESLARQVVDQLQASATGATIALAEDHGAEFTNPILFEVSESGTKYHVHIDPITRSSKVVTWEANPHHSERILNEIRNIRLNPAPHDTAQE